MRPILHRLREAIANAPDIDPMSQASPNGLYYYESPGNLWGPFGACRDRFVLRMSGGMQQEAPRTERGLRQTVADTEHIPDPADHMLEDLAYGATRAGIGKCPGYDGVIIQMWERP